MNGFTATVRVLLLCDNQSQDVPEWTRSCTVWIVWATPSDELFSGMLQRLCERLECKSVSLLLFFQDEDTKQDDEEGDEAAARCAPHEDRRRVGKAPARCQERSNSE